MQNNIYEFIKTESSRFETEEIQVNENRDWNMKNHLEMCAMLTDGFFMKGSNDWTRPFKKVIEPIIELANTAEDIELKNLTLFVKDDADRVQSFLVKKYHDDVYIKEHDIDELIDKITETDNKYGGVLIEKGEDLPEVRSLARLAFADQTDILSGPRALKFSFSPSQLRKKAKLGWGDTKNGATVTIDELITLSDNTKEPEGAQQGKDNRTTGKNIEVYIVRGNLPEHYLKDNDNMDKYYEQLHIVAFYSTGDNKEGVTLYRKEANEEDVMFFTSEPVEGQGLGKGASKFFNEQIWTNFLEIHKHKLLEAASKVPLVTDDSGFTNRQQIIDMENLEVLQIEKGSSISQVPTAAPANIQLLDRSIDTWFSNAQLVGFAQDTQFGKQSYAGQTFKGQERLLQQGRGPHQRAQGKRAKFIEKIYRKYIISQIKKEILKGPEFLATLDFKDLQWVSDTLAENFANKTMKNQILNGKLPDDKETLIQKFKEDFAKKGNQHKLKILKGEFKDAEIDIEIDVANKQHDLAGMTEKVFSIFQYVFSNPQGFQQVMQIDGMSSVFNDILEFSGVSGVDFSNIGNLPPQIEEQPQQQVNPAVTQPNA